MSILVTGATGTVGRLVIQRLVDLGAPVIASAPPDDHSTSDGPIRGRAGSTAANSAASASAASSPAAPEPATPDAARVDADLPTLAGADDRTTPWPVGLPQRPFDVTDITGLYDVLTGVRVLVMLHHDALRPDEVDGSGAIRLAKVAKSVGVEHLVYLSRVGVGRVPAPEYDAKHRAEEAVAGSGTGWTVLRSTAFHPAVVEAARILGESRMARVTKGWCTQPVDPDSVAEAIVSAAVNEPAGLCPDIAGPQRLSMAEACRLVLEERKVMVVEHRARSPYERSMQRGDNLPGLAPMLIGPSFEEWLAERRAPQQPGPAGADTLVIDPTSTAAKKR